MILYDVISEADRKKLRSLMPKSWRVKRPKETAVEMAVKVTESDVKDMAKMPQGR